MSSAFSLFLISLFQVFAVKNAFATSPEAFKKGSFQSPLVVEQIEFICDFNKDNKNTQTIGKYEFRVDLEKKLAEVKCLDGECQVKKAKWPVVMATSKLEEGVPVGYVVLEGSNTDDGLLLTTIGYGPGGSENSRIAGGTMAYIYTNTGAEIQSAGGQHVCSIKAY